MTPQELKNSILQLAIQGELVEQRPEEGTAAELYKQIQAEKQALIKAGKIKKEKPLPEIPEDEVPFEIPESWMWVRIASVITLNPKNELPDDIETAFIPMPCISDGYRNEHTYEIQKWGSIKKDFTHFADRDIGIAKITPCFQNRKSVVFKNLPNGYGAGTTELSIVRVIEETLSREFLLWFFKSEFFISNGKKSFTGTAGQQRIHKDYLATCMLPLPPLAEQKRIVAKIEELLPLIERYEKAWSRLEDFNKRFPGDMQKSILQMAIQGKLVEQRPEEGTGEELYKQIQAEKQALIKAGKIKKEKPLPEITEDEIPFEIPESWKWVSVGSVCVNIQYGSSQKSAASGKVPVLRMGNIQGGKIVYDKLVYTSDDSEIEKYPLSFNDLLFNRTNSKELVGKTAIYKGEMPAIYAGYLVRVSPVLLDSDYLNYVMQSQYYWTYCQTVRSDAIGQSNINAEKLKRFVFPLPPIAEQKRIVTKLEELLPLCERLKRGVINKHD